MRSVYYTVSESHLYYPPFIWVQSTNSVKRHNILKKSHSWKSSVTLEIPIQLLYSNTAKFFTFLKRKSLETGFCHPVSVGCSDFF